MTSAERVKNVGKLRPRLLRFARARLQNPAHAEDAVQDTLLAALENIESFSGDATLFSWLTGILKHKIIDCIRRSVRDQWDEMDNDGTPLNGDSLDIDLYGHFAGAAGWSDPERALERRRRLEALERCVRELPERTAETFFLRAVIGLNTMETCEALAVSESNCAVMLHRARLRIRETLAADWIAQ